MLSITTDYFQSEGNPEPYLKRIAEAGFSHVHWCHHWNTDYLYANSEIVQISKWLSEYGLRLLNLHASAGREKNWVSLQEYERIAGVELVKNRIAMAAALDSHVIILHVPGAPERQQETASAWQAQVFKSLDELEPFAKIRAVRIAIENMPWGDWETHDLLYAKYAPDFLDLCYDAGHGHIEGHGLEHLGKRKDRLLAVHLHDNDGLEDQHILPFSGTVDWDRLTDIIATSAYAECINLEVLMRNAGIADETIFLKKALQVGQTLDTMLTEKRNAHGKN